MSKREIFGLKFYKIKNPLDGSEVTVCERETPHIYGHLTFLRYLDRFEVESLLEEINNAINGLSYESEYFTDGASSDTIEIVPPNIIINAVCTVPLEDMKGLINEWLVLIS